MLTVVIALAGVWLLLCGKSNFNALGATSVEDTMKKISSRNTISVIDDMLKLGLTFEPLLRAIAVCFKKLGYRFV
jgi:hypothetical protein